MTADVVAFADGIHPTAEPGYALDVAIASAEQLAAWRATDDHGRRLKALNAIQLDSYIRAAAKAQHPSACN